MHVLLNAIKKIEKTCKPLGEDKKSKQYFTASEGG